MKSAFAFVVSLNICLSCSSLAQESSGPSREPIIVTNSQSPDGRKDLVIRDTTSESGAECTVYVRNLKTGGFSGNFHWFGFGNHPTSGSIKVLWRPDSRAFAIKYEYSRGYIHFDVYMLTDDGRCRLVHTPDLVKRVADKYHLEIYAKGGEHPTEWLSGNRLVVDEFNRAWAVDGEGDVMQPYRVTLQLPRRATSSLLRATIVSICPGIEEPSL